MVATLPRVYDMEGRPIESHPNTNCHIGQVREPWAKHHPHHHTDECNASALPILQYEMLMILEC